MMGTEGLLISVVVPTYKRPDLLQRCLSALLVQSLAHDTFEIIVCDDGPSRQAREVALLADRRGNGRPCVRYLEIRGTQGPAGARNQGWRSARAPIIAFTDDDTVPEPGWLQAGLEGMASGVQAAVGQIVMPLPPRASDYQRDAARLCQAEFATANCFVRREALEAVNGFDERFTQAWREDSDLHFSLIEEGFSVAPIPGAVVIHPLRPARFAASIGMQKKVMFDVLLYRKFPVLYRERIRSGPPWFYLSVTLALLLAIVGFLAGAPGFGAVALWLWAVMTLGFFLRRLWLSAFTLRNIGELLLSSVLIPPLSVFWRAVGAARFGWALP
ncbi:MAG TPA: glycosyltransferase [Burkholderiaceae bacterium]|nr:glycosyltransferase [Burkholderiaceae bacterium]